ncbi:MAG: Uma2 family endonuclease [Chloroflexota bacterium]|nr:Uma2 family endonuclease [Chloroflexota bacterium]
MEPHRYLITLKEYERMAELGLLDESTCIELIRGEIVEMAPIGFAHEMCVARLTTILSKLAGDAALVWPQNNSIRLAGNSRPQPDLTLLKWRDDYSANRPPSAEDVLLVVEVSETFLKYDKGIKGPLYAEAGIRDYWIINLREEIIEVHVDPLAGAYRGTRIVRRGEALALPGELGASIKVNDVLVGDTRS